MAYGSPVLVDAAGLTGADVPLLLLLLCVVTDESVVDVALVVGSLLVVARDLLLEVFVMLVVLPLDVLLSVVLLCVFVAMLVALSVAVSVDALIVDPVVPPIDLVSVVLVASSVIMRVALASGVADIVPVRELYAPNDRREVVEDA